MPLNSAAQATLLPLWVCCIWARLVLGTGIGLMRLCANAMASQLDDVRACIVKLMVYQVRLPRASS